MSGAPTHQTLASSGWRGLTTFTQENTTMKIQITADGRVFQGTPKQIVEAMKFHAFGQEGKSLSEYIDWLVCQVQRMNEIELTVEGDTDEAKATAIVDAILEAGLAKRLR